MESGIHGCGIRNPQTWNPESRDMESGIHRNGIRNPQRRIRNPGLSWITLHGAKWCCCFLCRAATQQIYDPLNSSVMVVFCRLF